MQFIRTCAVNPLLIRNGLNHNWPWAPPEDVRIIEQRSLGKGFAEISSDLNRSAASCETRYQELVDAGMEYHSMKVECIREESVHRPHSSDYRSACGASEPRP